MKALLLATALVLGAPAVAQDTGNAPPATGDQTAPVPSGAGQPMPTPGATDPTTPVDTLPQSALDNHGYPPGGVGAQTAETGSLPKCSRKVKDHCRE